VALSARQQRFVEEYLVDCNAAAAFRRAGYTAKDDHVASANAARLMANDSVRTAIDAALAARSAETGVTAEWVLRRLKEEADYTGEDATHSARVRALELCGKHLAMFVDRQQVETRAERVVKLRVVKCVSAEPAAGVGPGPAPGPNGLHVE
jgi:phage terminase small subunit